MPGIDQDFRDYPGNARALKPNDPPYDASRKKYDSAYPNGDRPSLVSGMSYTITGSGFGNKTGYFDSIQSAGILDLPLNSNFGTVGRWSGSDYVGVSNRPVVVNEGINGRCLRFNHNAAVKYNSVLAFNYDAPIPLGGKIFASRWVKHTCPTSTGGGQWKYERYQKSSASVSDKASEIYWNASSLVSASDNKIQSRNYLGVSTAGDKASYKDGTPSKMPHNKNSWVRMDTLITLPQAYGDNTFKFETWVYYDPAVQPLYTDFISPAQNINPYGQAGDEWNQHIYQNYFGNGDFSSQQHTLWMDKIFESVGDDFRVEYCDSADFTQRKVSFVQYHELWSDNQIYIPKADKGTLSSGYFHVIKNGVSVHSEAA